MWSTHFHTAVLFILIMRLAQCGAVISPLSSFLVRCEADKSDCDDSNHSSQYEEDSCVILAPNLLVGAGACLGNGKEIMFLRIS